MPTTRRISELDGLRALAILAVIPCHYTGFAALAWKLPEFGWIGVDVFFVLSGYLITTILLGLRTRPSPYKTFYARRAVRIFPPYYAIVILIALTMAGTHGLDILPQKFFLHQLLFLQAYTRSGGSTLVDVLRHPVWYLTHLPSMRLYAHHLPVGVQGLWPSLLACNAPFWSLSIEEYFYLLWAPIVLRCSRRWIVSIGIAVCIAELLLRWMAPDALSYFNIFYRFDTLLVGAFLALLFERWHRSSVLSQISLIFKFVFSVCALIIGAILCAIRPVLGREIRYSPLVLVVGITAFGIAVACLIGLLVLHSGSKWWLARLLRAAPLTYIGTISYTMYLVHMYASWLVLQVATRVQLLREHVLLQNVVAVVVTIMLARASWHFLEKPLLRWKDRRFPSAPHPPEPALS